MTTTPATTACQYLAWGGESEGLTLVNTDRIRRDYEYRHYGGGAMWERFALLTPSRHAAAGLPPSIEAASVRQSSRQMDEDDYIYMTYEVLVHRGGLRVVVDTFALRLDGRA